MGYNGRKRIGIGFQKRETFVLQIGARQSIAVLRTGVFRSLFLRRQLQERRKKTDEFRLT